MDYKHHYGQTSKKGTHSFNDMGYNPDYMTSHYIPPHYMDYKHHYGMDSKKGTHSFNDM